MRQADKLVRMANQIALNMASQGEAKAPAAVADHIRRFWDPRMRAGILAYAAEDGSALSPIARAAVDRIRADA